MSSSLENEDLENVQLVRMEDVQPSRERVREGLNECLVEEEDLETCIVDDLEYDNECVVDGNDEDSNIGSMVSIHSEEVIECEEISPEFIVPEMVVQRKVVEEVTHKPKKATATGPESWPTLEILPGGIINYLEKYEDNLSSLCTIDNDSDQEECGEMMYACAKCPQRFKYLCHLVKHVRWHTLEQGRRNKSHLSTVLIPKEGLSHIRSKRLRIDKRYMKDKVAVMSRIAAAISKIDSVETSKQSFTSRAARTVKTYYNKKKPMKKDSI